MSNARSAFLTVAAERGFIHQCTDFAALDARLAAGPVTAYVGYDCTADSLHIGNLMSIMLLRWFQKTGNKPIVLMGGGTTRIGHPSGKDESRQLLSDEQIAHNMAGIRQVFAKFLQFGQRQTDAVMVNNADWLDELRYIPLLRDVGRHFSVNRMLTQDSVRDGRTLFGLTTPLVTTASGAKMGKSAQGAVWLNAERLSPYDYWQFWRNTEDADVGRFLRLFTELPLAEIAKLEKLHDAEINEAKKVLATEATALCHGREAAEAAAETAREVFEAGGAGGELPEVSLPRDALERGVPAFELFVRAGLATSNGEARRLIKGGGARVNDVAVKGETQPVSLADLDPQGLIKLSAGRKRHALVRPG